MGRLTSLTDGLYFSENKFKHSLPTEIGMLESFVSNMVFKHNKLSSTLPSELAQLTSASGCILLYDNPRLEYYTIGKNLTNFQVPFIAGLSNTIPSEVGFQTGLSTFSCESLELEGSIPTEIGFGTLLTEVLLASNELESSLPSEIGTLRQLSTLDVHYNYFTAHNVSVFPTELGHLKHMTSLSVHSNSISGSIPSGKVSIPFWRRLFAGDFLFGKYISIIITRTYFCKTKNTKTITTQNLGGLEI